MDLAQIPHLREPFYSVPVAAQTPGDELPYYELGGVGLERLCFELLVAKGNWPRYFGRNGEAQFGIDLIVSNGENCDVYQCKNVIEFSPRLLAKWLEKFNTEWLVERPALPKPDHFVVVCPLPIRDREEIEVIKKEFYAKHNVTVDIWHRELLDKQLANQPDIVADLFSEAWAERFCDLRDWNQGLFRPVKEHSGERRAIDRFLELKSQNRIVSEEKLALDFAEKISAGRVVMLVGRSGSGKTIAALDLATSLDGGAWRVFCPSGEKLSANTLSVASAGAVASAAASPKLNCHVLRRFPAVARLAVAPSVTSRSASFRAVFTFVQSPSRASDVRAFILYQRTRWVRRRRD